MQLVKDLEREARLLDQKAAEARAALVKVRAQAAIDEKVRDACWRVLDKAMAKPSTSFTVLDKRERKMHSLKYEEILSCCELEAAKADSFEAHFMAKKMRGFAKDATIRRLKRMLDEAKKS